MHAISTAGVPEEACEKLGEGFPVIRGALMDVVWRTILVAACALVLIWPYKLRLSVLMALCSLFVGGHDYAYHVLCSCVTLCRWNVSLIVAKMAGSDSAEIDWRDVTEMHHELDIRFEKLWNLSGASLLLLPFLIGVSGASLICIVLAIVINDTFQMVVLGMLGLMMSFGVVFRTLWWLAVVTDMCTNNPSTSGSIVATAVGFMSDRDMSESSHLHHLKYMQFLAMCNTGVEICGILITKPLLLQLMISAVAYVPAVVPLASKLAHMG